eukprot:1139641_1
MYQRISTPFQTIDDALANYYGRYGLDYRDKEGKGLFLKFVIKEELDDPALPIEAELGDTCDPNGCAYTWMHKESAFPIPSYASIPESQKEAFLFYVLQYCYKKHDPPSDAYIQDTLIPKCHGSVTPVLSSPNTLQTTPNDSDNSSDPPIPYTAMSPLATQSLTEHKEQMDSDFSMDENAEGVTPCNPCGTTLNITRLTETLFKPKYPARAHLNIFTAKELTKELRDIVEEEFENELILYYYTDISTALQMNDAQMKEFTLMVGDKEQRLSIINYDLHVKGQPDEYLYGIIVPNDNYKIQQDKWLWKLDEFLTARGVLDKYKIRQDELPLSSRQMQRFGQQLSQSLVIEESLIDDTDWFVVQQIKSLKRNVKVPKVSVTLSKDMWMSECKKSFQNVNLPLIPVVVNKNNSHWIEWVKIVNIESQNIYIGISCKYEEMSGKWSVESICLDRGDIYNKHRLVGYAVDKSKSQLQHFKTSITEIRFSDNDSKDIDKKINVLKQQIRSQQDSIVRLKEALLRAKNANKYAGATIQLGTENQSVEDKYATSIQQHIRDFIDETEDDAMGCHGDAWLDQIVDDVIKKYDVLEFRTSPIGAKRNIYIDKQFTKSWMNYVLPRFADEAMMYYWLDYTTAMQMCQGYSKQYVNKETRKFVVAIINYELRDSANNVLYGIILCDDDKIEKKNDKYPYKLKTLMSKQQIAMEYGINSYDLPRKSRKNQEFIDKLLLKRRIVKQDLATISWSNLKLFKSQSTNNDPINKSVTITQKVMKEYCSIALERLNTHTSHKDLIPIVVIDKHNNYYGIEWVLIVHIIHRNCDVGISFRYDAKPNSFAATAIYLDKGEIESKHKLIGLKYDYCKHLRPFSLRKFKFKSDRHSIIDDDDDIAIHNGHRATTEFQQLQQKLASYQKAYQNEHGKVQQMHQQLRNTHNAYLSLKNQQYLFTAQQQQVPPAQYQNYVPQAHAHAAYNQYNNHSIIDNNMY